MSSSVLTGNLEICTVCNTHVCISITAAFFASFFFFFTQLGGSGVENEYFIKCCRAEMISPLIN